MTQRFCSSSQFIWCSVFVLCVSTRLLTTVYYIEDIDSLRFALSMVEYNVAKLQPHFPTYPVFCFIAKLIYAITGRFAIAFSLVGGISTFITIYFTLRIVNIQPTSLFGKFVIITVFMNPLLWLMSNRYMADAMGVACLYASLYFLICHQEKYYKKGICKTTIGFLLAGVLLSIRLSYLPFLLPILFLRIFNANRVKYIFAGTIGILIWFIPLLLHTGWNALMSAAQKQSLGHFSDFGGTVSTDPDFFLRLLKFFESIIADGFGLFWIGRHPITAITSVFLISLVVVMLLKTNIGEVIERFPHDKSILLNPIFLGCVLYLLWIIMAQNIVYKSRHVLPILPIVALGIAYSCYTVVKSYAQTVQKPKCRNKSMLIFAWCVVCIFLLCYSSVTLHIVIQHTKPTAIAQVHKYLMHKQNELNEKLTIVSVPLIKYYLESQDVNAQYITVESVTDLDQLNEVKTGFFVIGSPLPNRIVKDERTFYHNPYVNRMWSELSLYEY